MNFFIAVWISPLIFRSFSPWDLDSVQSWRSHHFILSRLQASICHFWLLRNQLEGKTLIILRPRSLTKIECGPQVVKSPKLCSVFLYFLGVLLRSEKVKGNLNVFPMHLSSLWAILIGNPNKNNQEERLIPCLFSNSAILRQSSLVRMMKNWKLDHGNKCACSRGCLGKRPLSHQSPRRAFSP